MPDLPQTIPISGENVDPQIPAVLPPLDGLPFIPPPSNGRQIPSIANEIEFNELPIDPNFDRLIRIESLDISEGAIRLIPRGETPDRFHTINASDLDGLFTFDLSLQENDDTVLALNSLALSDRGLILGNGGTNGGNPVRVSNVLHKDGIFDVDLIFPVNLPVSGASGTLTVQFNGDFVNATNAFISINGSDPVSVGFFKNSDVLSQCIVSLTDLGSIFANVVYNVRCWISDSTGQPVLSDDINNWSSSYRLDAANPPMIGIDLKSTQIKGVRCDLRRLDLGDRHLDFSSSEVDCSFSSSRIRSVSVKDSTISTLSLLSIDGLEFIDFSGLIEGDLSSSANLTMVNLQGDTEFRELSNKFSVVNINNVESLTEFAFKENSGPGSSAYVGGITVSSCPNLVSIRAVGLTLGIHPSNPTYSPLSIRNNTALDADALNQLYEDLADNGGGAIIDVEGTLGAANHDPTIATNKGYVVVG